MNKLPSLISCLCVTHNKPHLLRRAINCFFNQVYNNKQLVVVYEELDTLTTKYLESKTFPVTIKLVKVPNDGNKLSLGELRNLSVRNADGEFVCQWDDDDWYSEDRLTIQMKYLQEAEKPASILLRWIIFDSVRQQSYLSFVRAWEGSILCKKVLLEKHPYPSFAKNEDSPVINALVAGGHVAFIAEEPELYIYHYHGDNTWEESHFQELIYSSVELPGEVNREVITCMSL